MIWYDYEQLVACQIINQMLEILFEVGLLTWFSSVLGYEAIWDIHPTASARSSDNRGIVCPRC